jgi:hypothetical protein
VSDLGPRIFLKRDHESSSGRGCELYAAHFAPHIALIAKAMADCAPGHVEMVCLTEGYRKIRETRDLHETLQALDCVGTDADGQRNVTPSEYRAWAARCAARTGNLYDWLAHDAGSGWHLHGEYDPD